MIGADMSNHKPCIGVFDSGVGGLTVLKALLEVIPGADYLYFGDTARLPYGSKSAETVTKYAVGACEYLHSHGTDLLVIACNTATALALPKIERVVGVGVVGVIGPGAQSASGASQNRKVVVIGTDATISSHAYLRALKSRGVEAREKACPLLVPLVEEGWIAHPVTEQVARIYLDEAFAGEFESADVLVLGCTHYPLLKPILRRVAPAQVKIVDSAESTARAVAQQIRLGPKLSGAESVNEERGRGSSHIRFFATDSVQKFRSLGERFLGRKIEDVQHVDLKEEIWIDIRN